MEVSSQQVRRREAGRWVEMTVDAVGVGVEASEAGCVETSREPGRTSQLSRAG